MPKKLKIKYNSLPETLTKQQKTSTSGHPTNPSSKRIRSDTEVNNFFEGSVDARKNKKFDNIVVEPSEDPRLNEKYHTIPLDFQSCRKNRKLLRRVDKNTTFESFLFDGSSSVKSSNSVK